MKLSKTTKLVIAIGFFVIALIGLNMIRSQQGNQQNQLNEQLTLAQSRLNMIQLEKLSSQQATLEKQLNQNTSQFEEVKAILSQPAGSIAASSVLFDIAEAHGLEVTEMTSSAPATESLEGATCSVMLLTAKVEGDVPNLVSFITKLNSHFANGVVNSITITIPETTSDEASAEIQLAVYAYQEG